MTLRINAIETETETESESGNLVGYLPSCFSRAFEQMAGRRRTSQPVVSRREQTSSPIQDFLSTVWL